MTGTGRPDGADLVRRELEAGLHELEPVGFDVDSQLTDGSLKAVAWTYVGRLRPGHQFLGVHLREDFTLRGVTLIRSEPNGAVSLRWYIDWLDSLNRTGLNAALRPVPDGRQPDLDDLLGLVPEPQPARPRRQPGR
jgi:hypothetical protein